MVSGDMISGAMASKTMVSRAMASKAMVSRAMVCCLLVVLSGCVTHPPEPETSGASGWRLAGKVHIKTDQASRLLSVDWRQQDAQGELVLSGPLGIDVARIEMQGDLLTVTTGRRVYTYTEEPATIEIKGLGEITLPWRTFAQWLGAHVFQSLASTRPGNATATTSRTGSSPTISPATTRVTGGWQLQLLQGDATGPRLVEFTHPLVTLRLKITAWSVPG